MSYESKHREIISGTDGDYEIDIVIKFSVFDTNYMTLVECKHYTSRIKREKVQSLWTKVQSVGAHKGIMCATAGFQSGAIKFAKSHGIALIQVADGRSAVLAKASALGLVDKPLPPVGWLISGNSCVLVDTQEDSLIPLSNFLNAGSRD